MKKETVIPAVVGILGCVSCASYERAVVRYDTMDSKVYQVKSIGSEVKSIKWRAKRIASK